MHCLPHRLYNSLKTSPSVAEAYNTVLYDPNRPTHMGAGRGATNTAYSRPLTQHTSHVTINTGEYITSHRELSRVDRMFFRMPHTPACSLGSLHPLYPALQHPRLPPRHSRLNIVFVRAIFGDNVTSLNSDEIASPQRRVYRAWRDPAVGGRRGSKPDQRTGN